MKFSVGYSIRSSEELLSEIIRSKDKISEVYFSFGTTPSGRNDQTRCEGFSPWEAQAKQIEDLSRLHKEGLSFNLLFNANCYGEMSQSKSFFKNVGEIVDYIQTDFSLSSVTTTSPLIAKFIKQNFTGLDVRASVNMSIGSVIGMEYLKDYFDSFYVKRELNRNFRALRELRKFCDANGKEMYLLANSGCLNDCTAHTFHDNLVAHESEIAKLDNGYQFTGICREYLSKNKDGDTILSGTNFIRPEDTDKYDNIVSSMKLATRVHERPGRVIRAYLERQSFSGNVMSLLEPNHANLLYPYILENKKITVRYCEDRLVYTNENNAFLKMEDIYAYQQND